MGDHLLNDIGPMQRRGIAAGVVSICSSESHVIETAMQTAGRRNIFLIIESTCNQVNQFGGYVGMTPSDFTSYIHGIARKTGYPEAMLLIGGDHLGPYPWRREPAHSAMEKAKTLVGDCVRAGYGKIHLDCGMPLGDDPAGAAFVDPETSARRSVTLCRAAEAARSEAQRSSGFPLYVIGAEAPIPGGSLSAPGTVPVTESEEIERFLDICRKMFHREGLGDAWDRVAAIVVQPGIDFGPDGFVQYDPGRAARLSAYHQNLPGKMTYEIHSTDFQMQSSLSKLVSDHFALLKTGPVLSFAFREAIFGLARIEEELFARKRGIRLSGIMDVIDREMTAYPEHWHFHISPDDENARIHRLYGFMDRVRYYWKNPDIQMALRTLKANLETPLPLCLVSQYLPESFEDAAAGTLPAKASFLIQNRITRSLTPYFTACGQDRQ